MKERYIDEAAAESCTNHAVAPEDPIVSLKALRSMSYSLHCLTQLKLKFLTLDINNWLSCFMGMTEMSFLTRKCIVNKPWYKKKSLSFSYKTKPNYG